MRWKIALAVIAALESVALVTWFDEDTPLQLILACRPDVLVKGGDWPLDRHRRRRRSARARRPGAFHSILISTLHHRHAEAHPRSSLNRVSLARPACPSRRVGDTPSAGRFVPKVSCFYTDTYGTCDCADQKRTIRHALGLFRPNRGKNQCCAVVWVAQAMLGICYRAARCAVSMRNDGESCAQLQTRSTSWRSAIWRRRMSRTRLPAATIASQPTRASPRRRPAVAGSLGQRASSISPGRISIASAS